MDKLARAIELTDEILELLDNRDFDGVADIELERQPLIRQAFSEAVEQIDRIKASHLQKLNEQVIERLTELKQSVLQQQQQVRKAHKAHRAYTNAQPGASTMLAAG